jgi:hypothetical protein
MSTDEIVTEEMVAASVTAYTAAAHATAMPEHTKCLAVALHAVAPMIAARATKQERDAARAAADKINTAVEFLSDAEERLREAAAIRARGETI